MGRTVQLREVAYTRSGDKGADANVGVIARTPAAFETLRHHLTEQVVAEFFKSMGVGKVDRYELPNIGAMNFVLHDILDGGGSVSLRIDAQGKSLGQHLLELRLELPDEATS